MDACHGPTGVTRHALSQLERLIHRPEIALSVMTGRITHPDGLAYWESLEGQARRELPLRTRDILRWWRLQALAADRVVGWPARLGLLPGRVLRSARGAPGGRSPATTYCRHFSSSLPESVSASADIFERADLILSVSQFNTDRLLEAFPVLPDRVAYVPNGADDLFFETPTDHERARVREDLGLPAAMPYLLSVANFQPRKNLVRLIKAAARLPEVSAGDLALVLIGTGAEEEAGSCARRPRPPARAS